MKTKSCRECGAKFEITNKDLEFYDKISPTFAGKKHRIPSPTICLDCGIQRKMMWRNERKLYKRKCDLTGKPIISIYSEDKPYKIYDTDEWLKDGWDAMDYGQDFDFSKPFFEQLNNLRIQVPRLSNNVYPYIENTLYCNLVWNMKGSYICYNCGYCEDCLYGHETFYSQNCIDCLHIKNSQVCYNCYNCNKCSHTFFSQSCQDCSFAYFSYNCVGSNNIFLCNNLKNREYCIRNKQYTKKEYGQEIKKLLTGKYSDTQKLLKELEQIKLHCIHRENSNINVEDCIGNDLNECKNCENTFIAYKTEDCKNILSVDSDVSSCQDMIYLAEAEYCYNGISVAGYKNLFGYMVVRGSYNFYCELTSNCENCFACIGLKDKKYCIFNKQYSKEDYEKLVSQIIDHMVQTGEWGEFFPPEHSIFDYNESVAIEYFPLEKGEVINQGWKWTDKEYPINIPEGMARIEAKDLPELEDLKDEMEKKILTTAIICEDSGKPFRIIKPELEFYIKYNIPLPRKHHDIRHLERSKLRNPIKLYDRKCDKCGINMKTTYSSDRPETVYCESCYEKEIY